MSRHISESCIRVDFHFGVGEKKLEAIIDIYRN